MSSISAFLIGIGASIVAYITIQLVRLGYVPIINRLIVEDLISGPWISKYQENGKECTERIRLRQLGRTIRGTFTVSETGKGVEIQKFRAIYKNHLLTGEYWSAEKGVSERGTFTLRKTARNKMEGYYIFLSGDPWGLHQSEYVWERPET